MFKLDQQSRQEAPRAYCSNIYTVVQGLLSEKSAVHIFIHELGHSLGAKHDNESTECTNLTDETFLMTGDAKVSPSN